LKLTAPKSQPCPPLTLALSPLAVFPLPPLTLAERPLAVLVSPPPTLAQLPNFVSGLSDKDQSQ
jgi:hypothetical protein